MNVNFRDVLDALTVICHICQLCADNCNLTMFDSFSLLRLLLENERKNWNEVNKVNEVSKSH